MPFAIYPLIPWIGVMAAGYCFGRVYDWDQRTRRQWLMGGGLALTAAFIGLRLLNGYGDPSPWGWLQPNGVTTVLSFLRVLVRNTPRRYLFLVRNAGAGASRPWRFGRGLRGQV